MEGSLLSLCAAGQTVAPPVYTSGCLRTGQDTSPHTAPTNQHHRHKQGAGTILGFNCTVFTDLQDAITSQNISTSPARRNRSYKPRLHCSLEPSLRSVRFSRPAVAAAAVVPTEPRTVKILAPITLQTSQTAPPHFAARQPDTRG